MPLRRLNTERKSEVRGPVRVPGELGVSFVFFVSGSAGLIFEIVWFHQCGLVFGNSIWATSIVLSSFMSGLAVGNALVGWHGHRIGRFLRTYAALEGIVAITGLALTYGLSDLTGLLAPLTRLIIDVPWFVNFIRLVTAFAVLMVPATAMGATLPVLVGGLCRWRPGFGRVLGRLYGWNTLGAVTGVIGAEVLLIAHAGVTGSAWIAALLDVGAAAAALWMSSRASESRAPDAATLRPPALPAAAWRLLTCAFLAGGGLMALEVVWFRFLSMLVVNSTLAISLMLAVVLAAIGMGGLVASSWLKRRPHAATYLPAAAFTAGCVSAVSYVSFQFLTDGAGVGAWYRILYFACSLTLPTALLSGIIFTLLGEAVKRHIAVEATAAGWLTLANTTGAMCGPLVAAFVLLPVLGMEGSFFALALLYGVIGLFAVPGTWPALATASRRACWAAGLATVVVLGGFPFGLMAEAYFPRATHPYTMDGSEIIATREGPTQTIFLMQQAWMGEPIYHRLVTDGFSMSGTAIPGKRYMRYFVYWPMLVRHAPLQRVLVICYGVGVTAGAVTDLTSVESIDVVEISRDVVDMSDLIYSPDEHPLRDPRVRLHLEDGRYFLQVTEERFDLITGEPPPPDTPGTVNLYTREYFQLIHDRLTDGGIATYWVPIPQSLAWDTKAIIRAFCDVFKDCSLWTGTPSDWMLVGIRHPTARASGAQWSSAWNDPVLGPRLREIGFEVPEQIGATFLGDAAYLRALTADTPPLTDDYPRRLRPVLARPSLSDARYRRAAEVYGDLIDPRRAQQAFEASEFIRRLWPERLITETVPFFESQRIINRMFGEGAKPLRQIEDLHFLLTETPLRRLPLWILGMGNHPVLQHAAEMVNDGTGLGEYVLGLRALAGRDYQEAAGYLAQSQQRGVPGSRPLLVYALCLAGQLDAASRLAQDVNPQTADERHFWRWLESEFGVGSSARP